MQGSLRNRVIYLSLVGLYIAGGIWGTKSGSYVIQHPLAHFPVPVVLVLGALGLGAGWLAFYFFRSVFPKGWGKQTKAGRIALPLVFLIAGWGMMYGYGLLINRKIGKQEAVPFNGWLVSKEIKSGRKSDHYYITLMDSVSRKEFEFAVDKGVYYLIGEPGMPVRKIFYKGSLGILYRREP